MFLMKKIFFLTIVMLLLVSNVSVFAQDNNIIDIPNDVEFNSGAIVGYDASKEKEIFGELNQKEIDDILDNIAREVAKPGISNITRKYNIVDTSKLFIKVIDEYSEARFINNDEYSIEPFYDFGTYPKRVMFKYTVYLTNIAGNDISSKYQTTLTRTDIEPPRKYGFSNMVTEQQPGAIFTFNYKNVYSSTETDAYVRFSHYNLEYASWWRLDFNVSGKGEITVK
jgi:hypothetical protein